MVFYFKARPDVGDYSIFMGLDKYENEELIKYGFPEDIWFHVDKMSSAHVYVRLQKGQTIDDISEGLLEDCAQLVKANSIQGNKVNNIDVVYTPWSNLKKTASMDVGQVGFYNPKMVRTVRVEKRINDIVIGIMGISRDSRHKRRETGGKRKQFRKKRKFELGRQPANTKLGGKRVHTVRVRGGHLKFRALHLETGNFSWGTEVCARKTRILDVVYNASNNELVRTKTLVKGAVVLVDATPFRQWYEAHYGVKIGVKKNAEKVEEDAVKKSDHVLRKLANRQRTRVLDPKIDEQVTSGRLLAVISSRPGQSGRADGYLLEGKELEFYQRKLATKKSKK